MIDYDGANRCYYQPVNLDDEAILMQGGLDPTESDPRFHQQMVYAVAMRVLENFDRALGRRVSFRGKKLRLFPHADGNIRYVISKPLPGKHLADRKEVRDMAEERVVEQQQFVDECDLRDPYLAWSKDHYLENRMRNRFSFYALHGVAGLR